MHPEDVLLIGYQSPEEMQISMLTSRITTMIPTRQAIRDTHYWKADLNVGWNPQRMDPLRINGELLPDHLPELPLRLCESTIVTFSYAYALTPFFSPLSEPFSVLLQLSARSSLPLVPANHETASTPI